MGGRRSARGLTTVVVIGSWLAVAWLLYPADGRTASTPPPPAPGAAPPRPPTGVAPRLPDCTVSGTARADVLRDTRRADVLCGGGGKDVIHAGGSDTVIGGSGADAIYARNGRSDVIFGGHGRDSAWLDAGIDLAYGVERRLGGARAGVEGKQTTVSRTAVGGALGAVPRTPLEATAVPAEIPVPLFESTFARLAPRSRAAPAQAAPAIRIGRIGWYQHALVGKVYFYLPGDEPAVVRFCTGTVVAANVIITAAHCIYDQRRGFATSWSFVPRKWDTSEPLGRWEAREATVPVEWTEAIGAGRVDYAHDYGFLILRQNAAGQSVGDLTGTAGIVANYVSSWLWSIGYPAGGWAGQWGTKKGEGVYPQYCYSPYGAFSGPVTDARGVGRYEIGIGCTMTGGSSGGPWFAYANGSWSNIASLNSHCYPFPRCNRSDAQATAQSLWGPWFTDRVIADFEDARRR